MCPENCKRFLKCNAPICPLDKDWRLRKLKNEDSTCMYLLESVKDGAEARFEASQLAEVYKTIAVVSDEIFSQFSHIKNKADKARFTKSRMLGNPALIYGARYGKKK